jgi:hypothetical protein
MGAVIVGQLGKLRDGCQSSHSFCDTKADRAALSMQESKRLCARFWSVPTFCIGSKLIH